MADRSRTQAEGTGGDEKRDGQWGFSSSVFIIVLPLTRFWPGLLLTRQACALISSAAITVILRRPLMACSQEGERGECDIRLEC